jgi:hypothetical protein
MDKRERKEIEEGAMLSNYTDLRISIMSGY